MLKQVAFGFVLGFVLLRGLAGCGTAAAVECRAETVKFLPRDPNQVTYGDVKDLVARLQACERSGDAGR